MAWRRGSSPKATTEHWSEPRIWYPGESCEAQRAPATFRTIGYAGRPSAHRSLASYAAVVFAFSKQHFSRRKGDSVSERLSGATFLGNRLSTLPAASVFLAAILQCGDAELIFSAGPRRTWNPSGFDSRQLGL